MNWIQRFMIGRHGADQLSACLLILSIISMWIGRLVGIGLMATVGYLLLGFGFYRILSRDLGKRRRENNEFLQKSAPLRRKLGFLTRSMKEGSSHRHYVCTQCNKQLRVPRNKGKKVIKVVCPACRNQMKK